MWESCDYREVHRFDVDYDQFQLVRGQLESERQNAANKPGSFSASARARGKKVRQESQVEDHARAVGRHPGGQPELTLHGALGQCLDGGQQGQYLPVCAWQIQADKRLAGKIADQNLASEGPADVFCSSAKRRGRYTRAQGDAVSDNSWAYERVWTIVSNGDAIAAQYAVEFFCRRG